MLAGMALASIGVGLRGDHIGRRRLYMSLFVVMGAAGTVFAFTRWLPALILASLTGTLSTDPNESGPITSLEQAMIAGAPAAGRARVFGRYNAIAYLAGSIGALAAGGPAAFRRVLPALPQDQRWLLAFPVIAVACALLSLRLSRSVEVTHRTERPLVRSRGTVRGLVALLLGRSALSQMDVPARQAYVVTIVDPEERTAAAAYTNTARYLTRPAGPVGAGALMQVSLSGPFVVAGGLKIVYDFALYARF